MFDDDRDDENEGEGISFDPAFLVDRLTELTDLGRITWYYLYANDGVEDAPPESLGDSTKPYAYALDDEEFGFGRVVLLLNDRLNETDEPGLYYQGDYVEVEPKGLKLLIDTIKVHFLERVSGALPTNQERIHRTIEYAIQPYQLEHKRQEDRADRATELQHKLADVADKLATLALNQQNMQIILGGSDVLEASEVPFSSETLAIALSLLFPEEDRINLESLLQPEFLDKVVQEVHHVYMNKN